MRLLKGVVLGLTLFIAACGNQELPQIEVTKEQAQQFAFGLSLAGIDATNEQDAARYLDSALGICQKIRANYDVKQTIDDFVIRNNWENDLPKAGQFLVISTDTFCKDVQIPILREITGR